MAAVAIWASRSLEINTQFYADCATPPTIVCTPPALKWQWNDYQRTHTHIYLLLSRQRVLCDPANFNPSHRTRLILCKHFAAYIVTHEGKHNRTHTHTHLNRAHTHAGDTCKALNKQTEIVERGDKVRGGWAAGCYWSYRWADERTVYMGTRAYACMEKHALQIMQPCSHHTQWISH